MVNVGEPYGAVFSVRGGSRSVSHVVRDYWDVKHNVNRVALYVDMPWVFSPFN